MKFSAVALSAELGKHLLLLLLYTPIHYGLYYLSENWWVYPGYSTWYIPLGLRLAMLLVLPYRFWPTLFISGLLVYFVILKPDSFPGIQVFLLNNMLNELIHQGIGYFLPVLIVKRLCWAQGQWLQSVKATLWLLFAMLLTQLGNVWLLSDWAASAGEPGKIEVNLSFFVGGWVGILLSTPIILTLYYLWQERQSWHWPALIKALAMAGAILVPSLTLYHWNTETLYLLRPLGILPVILFAYLYRWAGANSMAFAINLLLAISVFGQSGTDLIKDMQFYIFVLGVSSLLLGALMTQQRQLTSQLEKRNLILEQLAERNRFLAQKVVAVQEKERKALSQELHDEVGQNITALQTELKVLEHHFPRLKDSQAMQLTRRSATQIYNSVYNLLHWLRPRILDELGLTKTLSGNYFSSRLQRAGIRYHCRLSGDIDGLDEDLSIALFRIVQEGVNNCIKHARADNFYLDLDVAERTSLNMRDDGCGISRVAGPGTPSGGFGLDGIRDRVVALNGETEILNDKGTIIQISIPGEQAGAENTVS